MGKYDDLKIITPVDQLLRAIANELSEHNRLKRLELRYFSSVETHKEDDGDTSKQTLLKTILEDEA